MPISLCIYTSTKFIKVMGSNLHPFMVKSKIYANILYWKQLNNDMKRNTVGKGVSYSVITIYNVHMCYFYINKVFFNSVVSSGLWGINWSFYHTDTTVEQILFSKFCIGRKSPKNI